MARRNGDDMSRFVRPEVVRLALADVSTREHQALLARKKPKATREEIDASAARVAEAETLGDTITVKKRLNAGEQRARFAREYALGADGVRRVDPLMTALAKITAYLLDWTLTDDGQKVPIAGLPVDELTAVLDNLDPDSFGDIRKAIDAHERAQVAESEDAKKKTLTGANGSEAISISPASLAGPTSTLPN